MLNRLGAGAWLMGFCHPVFKRAFLQRWLWGLLVLRTKRLSNCDYILFHVSQQRCISRAVELFLFSFNMTSFLQSANGAVDGAGASIASLRDGRNRWPAFSILPRMTFESKMTLLVLKLLLGSSPSVWCARLSHFFSKLPPTLGSGPRFFFLFFLLLVL